MTTCLISQKVRKINTIEQYDFTTEGLDTVNLTIKKYQHEFKKTTFQQTIATSYLYLNILRISKAHKPKAACPFLNYQTGLRNSKIKY